LIPSTSVELAVRELSPLDDMDVAINSNAHGNGIPDDTDTDDIARNGHSTHFLRRLRLWLTITSIIYVAVPLTALIWTWICDVMGIDQPTWLFEHHAWLASQFGYLLLFTVVITAFVINRYVYSPTFTINDV
jgi:hypothetical protein